MVSSIDIVSRARQVKGVVLAFNVPYLPMVKPVVDAVVDQDAIAMIATARLEWIKFESRSLAAVAEEFFRSKRQEYIWLHLDHVPVIDEDNLVVDYMPLFKEAIALGFQSVMVDGSRLPFARNIEATKRVAEVTHAAGIPCEAELGAVLGHEKGPRPSYEELYSTGKGFTDPDEAHQFVESTGCDWLSVAVGNVHGAISGALKDQKKVEARLNIEHVDQLAHVTGIPLVLHGGSGIKQEYLAQAIAKGVAKVNIGTEIRQAYEAALRQTNSVDTAQQAVYERTTWLIRDYFGVTGMRKVIGEFTRD
jgi:fructose-bisphosphate aldolase class II